MYKNDYEFRVLCQQFCEASEECGSTFTRHWSASSIVVRVQSHAHTSHSLDLMHMHMVLIDPESAHHQSSSEMTAVNMILEPAARNA